MPVRRLPGQGGVVHNEGRHRYEAVLTVDGRKHRRMVSYASKREAPAARRAAEAALVELRDQLLGPTPLTNETVAAFLARWLDFVEPHLRATTFTSYEGVVRNHIAPFIGKKPLTALRVADVDGWLSTLARQGRSPQVCTRARKVLAGAFTQAEAWELIAESPAKRSKSPAVPNVERRTLSPEQARAFLEAVRGDRLEALWLVGACLGMRSGEARGLRWRDISQGSIRIEHTLAYERVRTGDGWTNAYRLAEVKTPRSRRTVPLPAFVAEAFERRREGQRFEALAPDWANPWDLIFTRRYTGEPLSAYGIMTQLKRLLARAELPVVAYHDLRHAAASLLLSQGLPPRAVQDVLGHATSAMTMDTYGHVHDVQRQEVARTLEAWRSG
jgi:integrase